MPGSIMCVSLIHCSLRYFDFWYGMSPCPLLLQYVKPPSFRYSHVDGMLVDRRVTPSSMSLVPFYTPG